MRAAFIGASKFGLKCLRLIHTLGDLQICGIVSAPKTFRISYSPSEVTNVLHEDFSDYAFMHDIPLAFLHSTGGMTNEGLLKQVKAWKPDIFLVVGWYHMIPKTWRALAPAFGMHASLLPDYSGGAPLVWAMINGESYTGITLFQLDDGVDSGPVVAQESTPILPTDTISTLYERIEKLGLEILRKCSPILASGDMKLIPQDPSKRRIMPQRTPADGLINWQWNAVFIDRFIRAQTRPYPGAFTLIGSEKLVIWSAIPILGMQTAVPGTISEESGNWFVHCGSGKIKLLEATYRTALFLGNQFDKILTPGQLVPHP